MSGHDSTSGLTYPAPSFEALIDTADDVYVSDFDLNMFPDRVEAHEIPVVSYQQDHQLTSLCVPTPYGACSETNPVDDQRMPKTPPADSKSDVLTILDLDASPSDDTQVVSPSKSE